MYFYLYFASVLSICKASSYRFSLQSSTQWQFIGRKVQLCLTMDIPESTPIKCKIKLPFNGTAIMRITEVQFVAVSKHLTASINTTTLISSANDDINDICWIDLGNITRGSSENGTQIKIEFEVQVMNHAHIVNRDVQWVSVGVQYINQSVWASQLGIKIIYPGRVKKPDLKFSFWADIGGFSIIARDEAIYRLILSHSDLTTDEVVSGIIEWPLPPVLLLKTWQKVGSSINMEVMNDTETVVMKFGELKFADTIDLKVTFYLDLHKMRADGKLHNLTIHLNIKYNGTPDACSSLSASREFIYDKLVAASIKYYVPRGSCDGPLGMKDGSITNAQITASSHSVDGEPFEARLDGDNAWIPWMMLSKEKNQYLEVNFNDRVIIRRLSTQGRVKSLAIFYSDDGVIFEHYKQGSEGEDLKANNNENYGTVILLPVPVEAVFVRINPTAWQTSGISLKVEFYGCKLSQPVIPGNLTFSSRGYYLDETKDIMYICSVPTKKKEHLCKCSFSSDQGASWIAMDHSVISILGHDTVKHILYGVSMNGRAVLKSTTDHAAKFIAVPLSDWEAVQAKDTTNLAVMIGNDFAINTTNNTPMPITSSNGSEWGVSAKGVYVKESSEWKLKAVWMCSDAGFVDAHICSSGSDDASSERCLAGQASIVVDGVEMGVTQRGYNVVVLDREGNFTDFRAFDFHAYSYADDYLSDFLAEIVDNAIVLIAVMDEAWWSGNAPESDKQAADQQLRSLGAKNPRPSEYRASWALVGYKGSHGGVDWVRFAEAPRMQGPTEIGVKIPTPLHTYGCA